MVVDGVIRIDNWVQGSLFVFYNANRDRPDYPTYWYHPSSGPTICHLQKSIELRFVLCDISSFVEGPEAVWREHQAPEVCYRGGDEG